MKEFRDETDEKKLELFSALEKDSLDVFCGKTEAWFRAEYIVPHGIYQVTKRPMSIDWSVLKDEFICAARDKNGDASAYTRKPREYAIGCFDSPDGELQCITGLKSYDPGTVDWTESLIWKPGFEPK